MHARKTSAWTFDTSGTFGLTAGLVAGGAGSVSLKDPQGNGESLHYVGIGAGIGVGVDTPGNIGGSIAPGSYPNLGTIMILDGFHGDELSLNDMRGPCAIMGVQASFFVGGTGTAMFLGMSIIGSTIDKVAILGGPFTMWLADQVFEFSAKAMILIAGTNTSIGVSAETISGIAW